MKYITLLTIPALASSLSASVMIDNFNDSVTNITVNGVASAIDLDTALSSAIGGSRETRVHNTASAGPNDDNTANTNGDEFTWSQEADATGHFHLAYGSLIAAPDGFNLNANFGSDDKVIITVISSDILGPISVQFAMNVGEANESVWGRTVLLNQVGGFGLPSPYDLVFNFSDFTLISGTGAFDKTDVDGVMIEAAANLSSADYKFDNIYTIPEPSSTALLGLAGLALIVRRRRA